MAAMMMMFSSVVSMISRYMSRSFDFFDNPILTTLNSESDDGPRQSVAQEFDFGSNEESDDDSGEDEPVTTANMAARSRKLDAHEVAEAEMDKSDGDSEEDDDEPVTMANMAARSRKLDALAVAEAEMDAEALHTVVENDEDDDDMATDGEEDANGDIDAEPFHLPTPAERDEEKAKGGPDVQAVQRRMQHCIRVLARFNQRAEKGR
jgi:25S rRNA (cytosine2870-C5)-methyltransferase